jgi:DNA topoisomerase VI subunit A
MNEKDEIERQLLKRLQTQALGLLNTYDKKGELQVKIPIRSISNIRYDEKLRQYVIGNREKELNIKNISQSRAFTHLMWLMSYIKSLVEQNKTQTQRDIFYAAQTVNLEYEDQPQSDDAIHNIEAILSSPREDFHIVAKDKGFVFGDLDLELTMPGYEHQKRNLTSTPEGVLIGHSITSAKFLGTGAKKVIVAEKQAIFTRLLEDGAHKKYNAILIGSEGQFPRGLRLLSRRLGEELNLPVYIFTDSVSGDTPIFIRHRGKVTREKIGKFIDRAITNMQEDPQWVAVPSLEVLGLFNGRIAWVDATVLYRHVINKELYTVTTSDGHSIKITGDHSIFTLRGVDVVSTKGSELAPGQFLLSARDVSISHRGGISPSHHLGVAPFLVPVSIVKDLLLIERRGPYRPLQINTHVSSIRLAEAIDKTLDALLCPEKGSATTKDLIARGYMGHKHTVTPMGRVEVEKLEKLRAILQSGFKFVKIGQVRKSKFHGFVYDITTASQSFVCGTGDVLVHNSDPWGMHIANAAIFGSAGSSHLRGFNIPDATWAGVYASDIKRFDLPSIPLDERDLRRVTELKKDPHFQTEPWKSELEIFAKEHRKAELEAFSAKSFTYFVDDYLKARLKELEARSAPKKHTSK